MSESWDFFCIFSAVYDPKGDRPGWRGDPGGVFLPKSGFPLQDVVSSDGPKNDCFF